MKETTAVRSEALPADCKHQIMLGTAAMIHPRDALPLVGASLGNQLYSICSRSKSHSAQMTVDEITSTDLTGGLPRVISYASTPGRRGTGGVKEQRNGGQTLDVFIRSAAEYLSL